MTITASITAEIRITDARAEVIDRFTDRLMEALVDNGGVIEPGISGSLARGEVCVQFYVDTATRAEADSMAPRYLHDAIKAAGVRPTHDWTDIPGEELLGELHDEEAQEDEELADLVERQAERMVKRVTTELVDA